MSNRIPKVPPKAPPVSSKPPREVWFSCRATPGCEGKIALVVFTKGVSGQGSTTRYRCKTCNGTWHVQQ